MGSLFLRIIVVYHVEVDSFIFERNLRFARYLLAIVVMVCQYCTVLTHALD